MGFPPPPTRCVPAIMAAVRPRSTSRGTADALPSRLRPLWPHPRARNALPESGAGLGRAHRLGPRPGAQLAAHRLCQPFSCGRPWQAPSSGRPHGARSHPGWSRSTSLARRKPSLRLLPIIAPLIRRSPGTWRGSSETSARFPPTRSSSATAGSQLIGRHRQARRRSQRRCPRQ